MKCDGCDSEALQTSILPEQPQAAFPDQSVQPDRASDWLEGKRSGWLIG